MKIKRIEYLDTTRNECFLTLESGEAELVCFSDKEKHSLGEEINSPLHTLSVRNIIVSENNEEKIEKVGDYNYKVIGHLINKEEGLVHPSNFYLPLTHNLSLAIVKKVTRFIWKFKDLIYTRCRNHNRVCYNTEQNKIRKCGGEDFG